MSEGKIGFRGLLVSPPEHVLVFQELARASLTPQEMTKPAVPRVDDNLVPRRGCGEKLVH